MTSIGQLIMTAVFEMFRQDLRPPEQMRTFRVAAVGGKPKK